MRPSEGERERKQGFGRKAKTRGLNCFCSHVSWYSLVASYSLQAHSSIKRALSTRLSSYISLSLREFRYFSPFQLDVSHKLFSLLSCSPAYPLSSGFSCICCLFLPIISLSINSFLCSMTQTSVTNWLPLSTSLSHISLLLSLSLTQSLTVFRALFISVSPPSLHLITAPFSRYRHYTDEGF